MSAHSWDKEFDAQAGTDRQWSELTELPNILTSVPEFSEMLVPTALRPWIMDIAERMQCPPDFPAVAAMVSLAAVVGRQIAIRPKRHDDWTVVPNLWGAVIGRPGVLKTPAIQEPIKPLQRLEIHARDEYQDQMRDVAADEIMEKAHGKRADREIAAALKRGDADGARRLALARAEGGASPPVVRRRYMTSDTTVEALGELLRDNPRGVLLFRDELVGWLSAMDREGREGTRQFFLEAWNGDGRYTYDRIGRGVIDIEAACVNVLGAIQPGPLGEYLRRMLRGGAGDDGLVQRLQLAVWPDVRGEWRDVDRWPDTPARERAWNIFTRLDVVVAASYAAEREEDAALPHIRFSDVAQDRFGSWRGHLEARLRSGELQPVLEAHLSKFRSLVPTIALLSHLIDSASGAVSDAALTRALAWAEYLEGHARRIYGAAVAPEIGAAVTLAGHLRRGDVVSPFVARDIYRRNWTGLDVETAPKAIQVLIDHGWLRGNRSDTGGRPTYTFEINPAVRS